MSRTVYADATFVTGSLSTSSDIPLGGAVPYNLVLLAGHVAGNITFSGTVDNVDWGDVYIGDAGAEAIYTITTTAAGLRVLSIDGNKFAGLIAFRIKVATPQVNGQKIKVGLRDVS